MMPRSSSASAANRCSRNLPMGSFWSESMFRCVINKKPDHRFCRANATPAALHPFDPPPPATAPRCTDCHPSRQIPRDPPPPAPARVVASWHRPPGRDRPPTAREPVRDREAGVQVRGLPERRFARSSPSWAPWQVLRHHMVDSPEARPRRRITGSASTHRKFRPVPLPTVSNHGSSDCRANSIRMPFRWKGRPAEGRPVHEP